MPPGLRLQRRLPPRHRAGGERGDAETVRLRRGRREARRAASDRLPQHRYGGDRPHLDQRQRRDRDDGLPVRSGRRRRRPGARRHLDRDRPGPDRERDQPARPARLRVPRRDHGGQLMRRRLSPSVAVALVAILIATGAAIAAASSESSGDKELAAKVIQKLAPKLSVKKAKTAMKATNATNASSATTADSPDSVGGKTAAQLVAAGKLVHF